jgi:hypothetical protein
MSRASEQAVELRHREENKSHLLAMRNSRRKQRKIGLAASPVGCETVWREGLGMGLVEAFSTVCARIAYLGQKSEGLLAVA